MKVLMVSYSATKGGAAKAAFRAFASVKDKIRVDFVTVDQLYTSNGIYRASMFQRIVHLFKRVVEYAFVIALWKRKEGKRSINFFSSNYVENVIANGDYDIIHLHWINNNTLSIKALTRAATAHAIVITLHDAWFFLGVDHLVSSAKQATEVGVGTALIAQIRARVDNYVRRTKKFFFKGCNRLCVIAPSRHVKFLAESSAALGFAHVHVVPNPIPLDIGMLVNRAMQSSVASAEFVIAFPMFNPFNNSNKGCRIGIEALSLFIELAGGAKPEIRVVSFGDYYEDLTGLGVTHEHLGYVRNQTELYDVFRRANVSLVPSLFESFGQVAAESICNGTPVVAFQTSGHLDIIEHKVTGYLALPGDVVDLAKGILWHFQLLDGNRALIMKKCIDSGANFSSDKVGERLLDIYELVLRQE